MGNKGQEVTHRLVYLQGLLRARGARTPLPVFAAAGMAGAASSAVLYPLEVVRSRITCDTVRGPRFLAPQGCVETNDSG